jgi:hypothetical protein
MGKDWEHTCHLQGEWWSIVYTVGYMDSAMYNNSLWALAGIPVLALGWGSPVGRPILEGALSPVGFWLIVISYNSPQKGAALTQLHL